MNAPTTTIANGPEIDAAIGRVVRGAIDPFRSIDAPPWGTAAMEGARDFALETGGPETPGGVGLATWADLNDHHRRYFERIAGAVLREAMRRGAILAAADPLDELIANAAALIPPGPWGIERVRGILAEPAYPKAGELYCVRLTGPSTTERMTMFGCDGLMRLARRAAVLNEAHAAKAAGAPPEVQP